MSTFALAKPPANAVAPTDILTTLSNYVGGQLEIQRGEGGLFIGQIASIQLSDGAVVVNFEWLAKANTTADSQRWHSVESTPWRGKLGAFTFNDFGSGRACMSSTSETALFHAAGPATLPRAEVQD